MKTPALSRRIGWTAPLTFFALTSVCAAGGGDGAHEIPVRLIAYQALNFCLFFGFLGYVLRNPVRSYFATRTETFRSAALKAEAAVASIESERKNLSARLQEVTTRRQDSLLQTKVEAENLRLQILAEAKNLSENLVRDAERTAQLENARARQQVRDELLRLALQQASDSLSKKMADGDQKRLQSEFFGKMETVQR